MAKLQSFLFNSGTLITATTICSSFLGGAHASAETLMNGAAYAGYVTVPIQQEQPQSTDQVVPEIISPNAATSTQAADLLPPPPKQIGQAPPLESQSGQPETKAPDAGFTSNSTGGRLDVPLAGSADSPFLFGFGSRLPDVSALVGGVTRERTVLSGSHQSSVIYITNYFKYRPSDRQTLLLETAIDPHLFGFDLSFTNTLNNPNQGFAFNIFSQQSWVPVFKGGEREVYLPYGDQVPWLYRLGGGVEYFQRIVPKVDFAAGLNYQLISSRNAMFTSHIFPVDEFGDQLTVDSDGQDTLLTLNLTAQYTNIDDLSDPTQGTKVRIGIDQSFPVGNASILYIRFTGNATQFVPLRLYSSKKPQVLVFNLQAGTFLGDVPPYDAFTLGGTSSVRGFDKGDVGTGSSFVQFSTEYRFPLFSFQAFKLDWDVRGSVFFDYASDLGTANEVIGIPAIVRAKPGHGLGYGFGLAFRIPFGLFRLEMGFNDRGDSQFQFAVGDRY